MRSAAPATIGGLPLCARLAAPAHRKSLSDGHPYAAPAKVAAYQHLLTRIDPLKVNAMVDASKDHLPQVGTATRVSMRRATGFALKMLRYWRPIELLTAPLARLNAGQLTAPLALVVPPPVSSL